MRRDVRWWRRIWVRGGNWLSTVKPEFYIVRATWMDSPSRFNLSLQSRRWQRRWDTRGGRWCGSATHLRGTITNCWVYMKALSHRKRRACRRDPKRWKRYPRDYRGKHRQERTRLQSLRNTELRCGLPLSA